MKKGVFLVLAIALMEASGGAQPAQENYSITLEKKAQALISSFMEGRFEQVPPLLDENLRRSINPEILQEYWQRTVERLGPYKGVVKTSSSVERSERVAYVLAEWQKGFIHFRCAFDKYDLITHTRRTVYYKDQPDSPPVEPARQASEFIQLLSEKQFGKAMNMLSVQLKQDKDITAREIREKWEKAIEKNGPLVKQTLEQTEYSLGIYISSISLEFEKVKMRGKVYLDANQNRIIDAFFEPAAQEIE